MHTVVIDLRADAAQGVHQIADGALVHARHARETVIAGTKCQCRRQRTKRRSGIAKKKIGALDDKGAARTAHAQHAAALVCNFNAKHAQCLEHAARVISVEHIVDARVATRQCGEQQNAV